MNPMMVLAGSLIFVGCVAIFLYMKFQKFKRSEIGQLAGELIKDFKSGEGVVTEEEIARTPKSVSAMDSVYLPNIMKDFPEFSWAEWRARVRNAVMRYMQALDEGDASILGEHTGLRKKAEVEIAATASREYKNRRVYKTAIRRYDKTKGLCTIHTETSASYDAGGKTQQTVFDVDLVYVQDADQLDGEMLGYNCPNCGAPVKKLGSKVCEYCGTALEPVNIRVWQIKDIQEEK